MESRVFTKTANRQRASGDQEKTDMVELDMAELPASTSAHIDRFDKAIQMVRTAPTEGHANARRHHLYELGASLKEHANDLGARLEKGEAWLDKNAVDHDDGSRNMANHPQWDDRESQWFAWEAEYRAVMDALDRGKAAL